MTVTLLLDMELAAVVEKWDRLTKCECKFHCLDDSLSRSLSR